MRFLPGIFYHGSMTIDIDRFRTDYEVCGIRTREGGVQSRAVWFSHLPQFAIDCGVGRWMCGGRLYRVLIEDRNPYFISPDLWRSRWTTQRSTGRAEFYQKEVEIIEQVARWGYDAIVYCEGQTILELVVLDDRIIRPLRAPPPKIKGKVKDRAVLYCEQQVWPLLDEKELAYPELFGKPNATRFGRLIDPYTGKTCDLPRIITALTG